MENISVLSNKEKGQINLPPGFQFHPTNEELLTYYMYKKTNNANFSAIAIAEVDIQKFQPWDLPWKAKMGEDEWYFFCPRDRKYQTGLRTSRATEAGYWKSTGKDVEIYRGKCLIGKKKTLVFYMGRAPTGEKTNWVIHEYSSSFTSMVVLAAQLFCWTGQFIGHGVFEKRAPALLDNLTQAFLMAPFFVMREVFQSIFGYEPYPGFQTRVKAKIGAEIKEWQDKKGKKLS